MNTAEYLIKKLDELGIKHFFGLPGDYNFNIIYAIENNTNTKWIGCTNELNAGYAADGYARENGFGAIVTTYAVGELSSINAIAGSFAENVPVISIVGAPSTKKLENKELIHHCLMEPEPYAYARAHESVTQTTAFLNRDNAKIEIDRVLKTFVKERKPVYISIPEDIAELEISERDSDYSWISDSSNLKKVIEKITDKIKKADSPIILADILAKRFDAVEHLRYFAEKSKMPVTNFPMGIGIVDTDYENYLGTYLAEYGNSAAKKALETTDCLIAVGPVYSDFNSFGFKLPYKINSQIAIYGTYTYVDGKKYDNVMMTDVLEGISKAVSVGKYEAEKSEYGYKPTLPQGKLTSEYIYPRLQEFFKEGDIVVAEAGLVPYGIFGAKMPSNVSLLTQSLWCSIGWATAAAFGAGIAKPEKRVVVVTGEGAHQISAMGIGNMLKQGLKPVIIVLNNGGYTIERFLSGKPKEDFNNIININYSKFARIFEGDIWSTKVETADDFDKALKVTGIMNKLCYIEACTDSMDIPEIAKKVFEGVSEKQEAPKSKKKSKKSEKLTKKEDMDFSTVAHESLIIEDEE